MGGVPLKHHTKSKVGRRRSHLAIKPSQMSVCKKCGHPVFPHKYCSNCGNYGDKIVRAPKLKVKKSKSSK